MAKVWKFVIQSSSVMMRVMGQLSYVLEMPKKSFEKNRTVPLCAKSLREVPHTLPSVAAATSDGSDRFQLMYLCGSLSSMTEWFSIQ